MKRLILILGLLFIMACQTTTTVWKDDSIVLMQHESEGYYGCFGCSLAVADEPAMCIDPIMEMKLVEETPERYCDNAFNVVEK